MSRGLPRLLIALVLLCLGHDVAAAQTGGATAPLSGVVTDQNDAVVPGVTVVVRNNATGVSLPPVTTNHAGLFSVAALAGCRRSRTSSMLSAHRDYRPSTSSCGRSVT